MYLNEIKRMPGFVAATADGRLFDAGDHLGNLLAVCRRCWRRREQHLAIWKDGKQLVALVRGTQQSPRVVMLDKHTA